MSNASHKRALAAIRARQAGKSDDRAIVASQHRIVTRRGNVATGSIDVIAPVKVRAFRVELNLPSPCDEADRAQFLELAAYRDAQWAELHNRKG